MLLLFISGASHVMNPKHIFVLTSVCGVISETKTTGGAFGFLIFIKDKSASKSRCEDTCFTWQYWDKSAQSHIVFHSQNSVAIKVNLFLWRLNAVLTRPWTGLP